MNNFVAGLENAQGTEGFGFQHIGVGIDFHVAIVIRVEFIGVIIGALGECDSVIDVCQQLKDKGAKRIFVFATFGLFCNGLENMDKAYEEGIFTKIFTTNLVYRTPELLKREWYEEVNLCKYVAYIIDTLNHDRTISNLLDQSKKIHVKLEAYNNKKVK